MQVAGEQVGDTPLAGRLHWPIVRLSRYRTADLLASPGIEFHTGGSGRPGLEGVCWLAGVWCRTRDHGVDVPGSSGLRLRAGDDNDRPHRFFCFFRAERFRGPPAGRLRGRPFRRRLPDRAGPRRGRGSGSAGGAATIGVGSEPHEVASDGTHVWVSNFGANTVSEIGAATARWWPPAPSAANPTKSPPTAPTCGWRTSASTRSARSMPPPARWWPAGCCGHVGRPESWTRQAPS